MEQPFETLLRFTAACGGDVDTVGAMAGAIWGACNGEARLPEALLETLEDRERSAPSPSRFTMLTSALTMPDEREVAEALGDACEGRLLSDEARDVVMRALRGRVATTKGDRLYYAQVDTMALDNVDTDEAIWSTTPDGLLRLQNGSVLVDLADEDGSAREELFPLSACCDDGRIARVEQRLASDEQRRVNWNRFKVRALEPLRRLLLWE